MTTVVYDSVGSPRVTLTKDGTTYTAVLEVEGLDVQRSETAEERFIGITSLSPPTVVISERVARLQRTSQHRALIDAAQRAVAAACTSTTGETGGPGGLLMTYYRVARAVRRALRLLGEEI